jgi:23S rRNA pseudouridine1911/1915/1917 synthase
METSLSQEPSTISLIVQKETRHRLDLYIIQQLPHYSRNFIQNLIKEGLVQINGKTVLKTSFLVKEGDQIVIFLPQKRTLQPAEIVERVNNANLAIEVIADREHFLVIYKPDNLLVHAPSERSNAVTLVDWLILHYPELIHVGYSDRPGIVHRLDKDTSGLLVVPRTPHGHAVFSKLFKDRAIQKIYYAVVEGNPPAQGTIDVPIGRSHTGIKMATYPALAPVLSENKSPQKRGVRHAVTEYKVLQYFKGYSLVEARLITGRTHQIRVHFASLGHPVVGDPVYGKKSKLIKRQALHAYSLSFEFDGVAHTFVRDLPEDIKHLITSLKPLVGIENR